jgi:hypothetical protein
MPHPLAALAHPLGAFAHPPAALANPLAALVNAVSPPGQALAAQHAHHATHLSGAAIALAALGALVVLACAAWGAAWMLAYEPRWTLSLRHSLAEAGFRASATWAEFADWARLGR